MFSKIFDTNYNNLIKIKFCNKCLGKRHCLRKATKNFERKSPDIKLKFVALIKSLE